MPCRRVRCRMKAYRPPPADGSGAPRSVPPAIRARPSSHPFVATRHSGRPTKRADVTGGRLPVGRKWWTLIAVSVATFMLLLDITVVNVALPSIREDLGASFTDLQWVFDTYTLTLAALVLTAGSLADRMGRRRLFAVGLSIFTVASLLCALAPDPTFLNLARALQGAGGAAMFAVSLALVAQEFPAGRERGTAMGIYGASIGVAVAIGPLVGGALTDTLGWESIFYLNVPIGIAAIGATYAKLRESRDPNAIRVDWAGVATFSAALFVLVFA